MTYCMYKYGIRISFIESRRTGITAHTIFQQNNPDKTILIGKLSKA